MTASVPPRISPEEYLEIERSAEIKSEYFDGEMFAMSGGTLAHSLLGTQLAGELRNRLRRTGCRPPNSELKIGIT